MKVNLVKNVIVMIVLHKGIVLLYIRMTFIGGKGVTACTYHTPTRPECPHSSFSDSPFFFVINLVRLLGYSCNGSTKVAWICLSWI